MEIGSYEEMRRALAEDLWGEGAVRVTSDDSLALQNLDQKSLEMIGKRMQWLLSHQDGLENVAVAGVPYTGNALASTLGRILGSPIIALESSEGVRVESKSDLATINDAVVVDTTLTDGASLCATIKALRESGIQVDCVCVVIDCEQGGAERVVEANCRVLAIFTVPELLRYGEQMTS